MPTTTRKTHDKTLPNRRAVLKDRKNGFHILGWINPKQMDIPPSVDFDFQSRRITANLLNVTPRMALYVEA